MAASKLKSQKTGERGRPSVKTDALKDEICRLIAVERLSARKACDKVGLSFDTFWRWLATDKDLSERYAIAKEMMAEQWADEIVEIADQPPELVVDDAGAAKIDSGFVQYQRLRVDARKWISSRLMPKKYGETIKQEVTGAGGGPVQHAHMAPSEFKEIAQEVVKEV